MPTFSPGYVEPGTFVEVELQNVPQPVAPLFVTALIGTTSLDKPVTKSLVRNSVAGFNFSVNTDGTITTGVADADETDRRDILEAVAADVTSTDRIIDELGIEWLNGANEAWVSVTATAKDYIEWAANYTVTATSAPGGATAFVFAGEPGSGLPIEISRVTSEPSFTGSTAVTVVDGTHTLTVNRTVGVFTFQLDGTAAVTVTAGGEFNVPTVTPQFRIKVDIAALTAAIVAAGDVDGNYIDGNVVSTNGPTAGTTGSGVLAGTGTKYTSFYHKLKDATDLAAQRFDDIRSLQSFNGDVTSTSGTDALSFGAVPYFRQGGSTIVSVPLRDILIDPTNGFDLTVDAGYVSAVEEALTRLEDVSDVSCVIVLSPTETASAGNFRPGILNAVKSHVLTMSSVTNAKPRMALLGARAGTTTESVFTTAATTLHTNRVVYIAPATATITLNGVTKTANGSSIAAAISGILSNPAFNAGEPISGKAITAFDDVPDPFTRTQKNRIGGIFGTTIIEKQGGAPIIRHFLTTDQTSALTAEAKITRIEIDVRRSLKQSLDSTLINTRLLNGQTIGTAKSIIGLILGQKISDQVINEFNITKIAKNATEPRQLDVEVAIRPVFDLNWIFLKATFTV